MNFGKIKTVGTLLIAGLFAVAAVAEEREPSLDIPSFDPVKEVQPVYPQRALDRKTSGYALVKYKIGSNGQTEDVDVVESEPAGVFNAASTRAVKRTKFTTADASKAKGGTFYKMYVYELDNTNANALANSN